jgi:hypothetical protein
MGESPIFTATEQADDQNVDFSWRLAKGLRLVCRARSGRAIDTGDNHRDTAERTIIEFDAVTTISSMRAMG